MADPREFGDDPDARWKCGTTFEETTRIAAAFWMSHEGQSISSRAVVAKLAELESQLRNHPAATSGLTDEDLDDLTDRTTAAILAAMSGTGKRPGTL